MHQTIGVLAHVDAGKTTLSEMMLFHGGTLRKAGRVDSGDTCLDFNPVERSRGVTIYSSFADFNWMNVTFHLIDTPGHPDFSAEMEAALQVLDMAVLVVSAVEGVQSQTEAIWNLLRIASKPTLIFINKTDRAGADPDRVRTELKRFSPDCTVLSPEAAAERNDRFLEAYCEADYSEEQYRQAARETVLQCRLFPIIQGSALKDEGVTELLDLLSWVADDKYNETAEFGAQVWKIRRDKNGVRWAMLKITSGRLISRMDIMNREGTHEKIGELRLFQGEKSCNLKAAKAGMLCAASGLSSVKIGENLGVAPELPGFRFEPVISAAVRYPDKIQGSEIYDLFKILEDEDSSLRVTFENGQVIVNVAGAMQLEVLPETIECRFGVEIAFEKPAVIYKETIAGTVFGYGHFEPLRHYSEVHFRLEPMPAGSGMSFQSECPTDILSLNWQRLIETHVFERKHKGVLIGAELTDVRIVLTTGRAHVLHTAGGDFREATYRGIRQGLMKAESVLLEPIYDVKATVDPALFGNVVSHFQKMQGEVYRHDVTGECAVICAKVPVIEMMDYILNFASLTHGKGGLILSLDGWKPCHDAQQVIEEAAYKPESDLEHTPDSVFCDHGVGRQIKWNEAEDFLHLGKSL